MLCHKFKLSFSRKKMLKSIIRSVSLMTLAVIGFSSAPAFANGDTCEGSCPRTRACQYNAKELTLNEPSQLTPTLDPPVQLVDPPAFTTPTAPVPVAPLPPTRGPRRGIFRPGRG
jgi:hypothetical protein